MSDVVLHIVLVGFHHKKGCQVEYSYPPMLENNEVPEEWNYLPFLALPDGCHNYTEDSTIFTLPPLKNMKQSTVFGVSCYRQIASDLLINRDQDVTRGSVQKSVVVLTQHSLFGLLLVKLKMITEAYFEEKDFSKKGILKELYEHINLSITADQLTSKSFGFSPQSLFAVFNHKVLILFKLILLEKRVLFYATPVNKLVKNFMSLLSLFPDLVEKGLTYACTTLQNSSKNLKARENKKLLHENDESHLNVVYENTASSSEKCEIKVTQNEMQSTDDEDSTDSKDLEVLNTNKLGFPLSLFTNGYMLQPYVCLQQLDQISGTEKGFVVGASNMLFLTQSKNYDVIVNLETNEISYQDADLKKLLHLTSADLRFAEHLVENVKDSGIIDEEVSTNWKGGDEWTRSEFQNYLLSMLACSLPRENCDKDVDDFNTAFINAWKETNNYKKWFQLQPESINEVSPHHPHQAQWGITDVKLRIHHNLQSSVKGRKIEDAFSNVDQYVSSSSKAVSNAVNVSTKAVSSAFDSAKSGFINWMSKKK